MGNADIRVAYVSDPEMVTGILMGGKEDHGDVLEGPGSRVFSREFGNFALNFQVICWVEVPAKRIATRTDLLYVW